VTDSQSIVPATGFTLPSFGKLRRAPLLSRATGKWFQADMYMGGSDTGGLHRGEDGKWRRVLPECLGKGWLHLLADVVGKLALVWNESIP
jgi:hypothetical protein